MAQANRVSLILGGFFFSAMFEPKSVSLQVDQVDDKTTSSKLTT